MARYGVQVIGRGRQCFVLANLPGEGGYRKGPLLEEEAVALAESLAQDLKSLKSKPVVSNGARRTTVVLAVVMIALVVAVWLVQ